MKTIDKWYFGGSTAAPFFFFLA